MNAPPSQNTSTLRAVIFDYGMVLSGPPEPSARAALLALTGLGSDAFDAHYWKYRLDYDRGDLNGQTYWNAVARDAKIALTPEQIDPLIEQDVRLWATVNPVMLDWMTRLRATGIRTAILSNMGEDLLGYMRKHFAWLKEFDALVWSCEIHATKPEPAIYRRVLQKLGVLPEEALFLDDKEENVEGARKLDIHALRYQNVESLESDLREHGWLSQLPPVIV